MGTATAQQQPVIPRRGKPRGSGFQKGKSGNPAGRLDYLRFKTLVEELSAEVGGNPTPVQKLLIEQLATLKLRAKLDDVRTANAMTKIVRQLGLTTKKVEQPDKPSISSYLDGAQ